MREYAVLKLGVCLPTEKMLVASGRQLWIADFGRICKFLGSYWDILPWRRSTPPSYESTTYSHTFEYIHLSDAR